MNLRSILRGVTRRGRAAVRRHLTWPTGDRVNAFIIGTQRGGTTSLFSFLSQLQEVRSANVKEVKFFSHDALFERGVDWYKRQFRYTIPEVLRRPPVVLDATPEYMYYPDAVARIHAYNPDAKIIVVLREPVSRAYSHWSMFKHWLEEGHADWLTPHLALVRSDYNWGFAFLQTLLEK